MFRKDFLATVLPRLGKPDLDRVNAICQQAPNPPPAHRPAANNQEFLLRHDLHPGDDLIIVKK